MYVKDANNLIEQYYNKNINLESDPVKVYTGTTYTLGEIVDIVINLIDFKGKVIWSGKYDNVADKDFKDDNKLINYKLTPLHKGIEETINWFKKNNK